MASLQRGSRCGVCIRRSELSMEPLARLRFADGKSESRMMTALGLGAVPPLPVEGGAGSWEMTAGPGGMAAQWLPSRRVEVRSHPPSRRNLHVQRVIGMARREGLEPPTRWRCRLAAVHPRADPVGTLDGCAAALRGGSAAGNLHPSGGVIAGMIDVNYFCRSCCPTKECYQTSSSRSHRRIRPKVSCRRGQRRAQ